MLYPKVALVRIAVDCKEGCSLEQGQGVWDHCQKGMVKPVSYRSILRSYRLRRDCFQPHSKEEEKFAFASGMGKLI